MHLSQRLACMLGKQPLICVAFETRGWGASNPFEQLLIVECVCRGAPHAACCCITQQPPGSGGMHLQNIT
jgi:hypothetical protein